MAMKRLCYLALLLLGLTPLLGQEHSGPEKSDPFAELPDTKMMTVEYTLPNTIRAEPSLPREAEGGPSLRKTAQEVLESYGVHFPKGASADYETWSGKLRVTQTLNNLEKIDEIVESIQGGGEKAIFAEVEVFEMAPEVSAPIVELVSSDTFRHNPAYDAVLKEVRDGRAKRTAVVRTVSRSGQRARAESVSEVTHIDELKWDAEAGRLVPNFVSRNVGTSLEIDPVIGIDDFTLDFGLVFLHDYRAPEVETLELNLGNDGPHSIPMHRFYQEHITTQITTHSGSVILLGRTSDGEAPQGDSKLVERWVFFSARLQALEQPPDRFRRTINENPEVEESE